MKPPLLAACGLSVVFAAVFITPFCGWVYRCGCTYLWAGIARRCNIHDPATPNCPWCLGDSPLLLFLPLLLIVAGQCAVLWGLHRGAAPSAVVLTLVGVVSFFVLGGVLAFIYKLVAGYPHFFLW